MKLPSLVKHIELWLIDKLIPFARNPGTHSDEQIVQIAASIKEFGFNSLILVDSNSRILSGRGRYLAALELGLETVPVIVLDHLCEIGKPVYLRQNGPAPFHGGRKKAS